MTAEIDFETGRTLTTTDQGSEAATQTLGVRKAFIGAHLPNAEDRVFPRLSLSLTDLLVWSGWRGPADDFGEEGLSLRYEPPEPLTAQLPWGTLTLGTSWSTSGDGISSRSIAIGASFVAVREAAVDADVWLREVIRPLRDLLTLMTDRANQVVEVEFEWQREPRRDVEFLYAPTRVELPPETGYSFQFPTTATEIADRFEGLIQAWFDLHSKLGPALDLLLATRYRASDNIENRFLNTAGAAEAYHRRTTPVAADLIRRHEERVARIAEDAPTADRRWLKWRLKYAYEPVFSERIAELVRRASGVLGGWADSVETLPERMSAARNVLVHRDPSATGAPTGQDMLDMMEDMALVLIMCIFQDLGLSDDAVRRSLERTDRWRFFQFRKRGWRD